jgi:DNA-binding IclR family transcriptional regulator
MEILLACASRPRRLGELSEQLDVHRSTVLRLLQTMESQGFTRREPDGAWSVGYGLVGIAAEVLNRLDVATAAHTEVRSLASRFGHTIHLAELIDDEVLYVDKVEGEGALRMGSRVGRPAKLHSSGVAKAILAFNPRREEFVDRIEFIRFTPQTITTRAAYLRELDHVVERGFAVDDREHEEYLSCLAAPIRNRHGEVVASVSITALTAIESPDKLRERAPELISAADRISHTLGHKP